MFITFEGPEGSGKSTQARALVAKLRSVGRTVVVAREPGVTATGEAIRRILLNPDGRGLVGARAEALLFNAARAQLVDEVLRPALGRGDVVVCDRFSDSTFAYQVAGRGLPKDAIAAIVDFATGGLKPDLTFLLDLDVANGLSRKARSRPDRVEGEALAFHEAVREGYRLIALAEPDRVVVVDGLRPVEDLSQEIWSRARITLQKKYAERADIDPRGWSTT